MDALIADKKIHLLIISLMGKFNFGIFFALVLLCCCSSIELDHHSGQNSGEFSPYGPWIVQLYDTYSEHDILEKSARLVHLNYSAYPEVHHQGLKIGFDVTHSFRHALNALVIRGILKQDILKISGVQRVHGDSIKHISSLSWGVDRIDQASLPISSTYNPVYIGTGVDIYIIDTGIDTTNTDFSNIGNDRNVSNIYNSYGSVSSNTDDNGHGTHVAGIHIFSCTPSV